MPDRKRALVLIERLSLRSSGTYKVKEALGGSLFLKRALVAGQRRYAACLRVNTRRSLAEKSGLKR